ncbi:Rrp15p-domain-containing protein [Conidiobolus coronatus NRRL 28638]|uniref:Rrp15p-domain-containing protein n=1 Tax=Conidiobolus coronatus (strain ATCC 28846 / CBS 209.66 / NRRL 28638) TaxID=796925 RepID=A0A137PC67_CONC2|nr:Rrp15p-domain-containing protein [Conidiobolus coronatus NRRL 28638]|eukprot:KXN72565.1 Rrp15p-domain-containing protein [Conidiobolus coronatus NRRL 28638]
MSTKITNKKNTKNIRKNKSKGETEEVETEATKLESAIQEYQNKLGGDDNDADADDEDQELSEEADSEGSDGSEDESNDEGISAQKPAKKKKRVHHTSEDFSSVLASLVNQSSGALPNQTPVLSKSKQTIAKLEDEKLEEQAKKLLKLEKKAQQEKAHVLPDHKTVEYEKKLRKVATRGVVKLFNAIKAQQRSDEQAVGGGSVNEKIEMAQQSKSNFLSMLKNNNI